MEDAETRVDEVTEAILDENTTYSRWQLRHRNGTEVSTAGSYTRAGMKSFINDEAWTLLHRL